MSLYDKFIHLVKTAKAEGRLGGSSGVGESSEPSRSRDGARSRPEEVEIAEDPSFEPHSTSLRRLENRMPERLVGKIDAKAIECREQLLKTACTGQSSSLLPANFRCQLNQKHADPKAFAENRDETALENLTGRPFFGLYFKELRRSSFLKSVSPGDAVIVRILKSTLQYRVGSLQVKVLGWSSKRGPVILWDHNISGDVSLKEAQMRVIEKARINDIMRCEILDIERLKSLNFVELTTLPTKSSDILGLLEDEELERVKTLFFLALEGKELPEYSATLEKSLQLESMESLAKIRDRLMLMPGIVTRFAREVPGDFSVKSLRNKQDKMAGSKLYEQGFSYVSLRELERAKQCFEKALELDPTNIPCYIGVAVVHQERQEHKRALEVMYKALERDPNHPHVPKFLAGILVSLGQTFVRNGQMKEAIQLFEKAVKFDRTCEEAAAELRKLGHRYERPVTPRPRSRSRSKSREPARRGDNVSVGDESPNKWKPVDGMARRQSPSVRRRDSRSRSRERGRRRSRSKSRDHRRDDPRNSGVDIEFVKNVPPPVVAAPPPRVTLPPMNVPPPIAVPPPPVLPAAYAPKTGYADDRSRREKDVWKAKTEEFLSGRASGSKRRRSRSRSRTPDRRRGRTPPRREWELPRRRHHSRSRSPDDRRRRRRSSSRSRSRSRDRRRSRDRHRTRDRPRDDQPRRRSRERSRERVSDAAAAPDPKKKKPDAPKTYDDLEIVSVIKRTDPATSKKEIGAVGPLKTVDNETDRPMQIMWKHWRLVCRDRKRRYGTAFINWFKACLEAKEIVDRKAGKMFDIVYGCIEPALVFPVLYPDDRSMDWLFESQSIYKKSSYKHLSEKGLKILAEKNSTVILHTSSGTTIGLTPTANTANVKENFPDEVKKQVEKQRAAAAASVAPAPAKTKETHSEANQSQKNANLAVASSGLTASKFGIMKRKKVPPPPPGAPPGKEAEKVALPECEIICSPTGADMPMDVEIVSSSPSPEPEVISPPKKRRLDLLPNGVVPGEEPLLVPVFPEKTAEEDHRTADEFVPARPPLPEPILRALGTYRQHEKKFQVTLNDLTLFKATRPPWTDDKWFGGKDARSPIDDVREAEEKQRKIAEAAAEVERKKKEEAERKRKLEEEKKRVLAELDEAERKRKQEALEKKRKAEEEKKKALEEKKKKEEELRMKKQQEEEEKRKKKQQEEEEKRNKEKEEKRKKLMKAILEVVKPDEVEDLLKTLQESAASCADLFQKKDSTEEGKPENAEKSPEVSVASTSSEKQQIVDCSEWQVQDEVAGSDHEDVGEGLEKVGESQPVGKPEEKGDEPGDQLVVVDAVGGEEGEKEKVDKVGKEEEKVTDVECLPEDLDQLVTVDEAVESPAEEAGQTEKQPAVEEEADQLVTVDVAEGSPEGDQADNPVAQEEKGNNGVDVEQKQEDGTKGKEAEDEPAENEEKQTVAVEKQEAEDAEKAVKVEDKEVEKVEENKEEKAEDKLPDEEKKKSGEQQGEDAFLNKKSEENQQEASPAVSDDSDEKKA